MVHMVHVTILMAFHVTFRYHLSLLGYVTEVVLKMYQVRYFELSRIEPVLYSGGEPIVVTPVEETLNLHLRGCHNYTLQSIYSQIS